MQTKNVIVSLFAVLTVLIVGSLTSPLRGAEKTFQIHVVRGKDTTGKLTCKDANVADATCYWKKSKRIPAGTYTGCSTTTMATKNHHGVFIPDVKGFTGIFIHPGKNPGYSDGCIVADEAEIERIWNTIPQDKKNITVTITDE